MSKIVFLISDSKYIFDGGFSMPRGGVMKHFSISEALSTAGNGIIHSYDYSEDVYVTLNGNTASFTSVSEHGALTVAVVRNSLESFSVTKVAHGNVSVREVENIADIAEDDVDDFYVIVTEVCKEMWS